VVEGRDGAGLAVEALQAGRIARLRRRQHLDRHPPPHQLVFAQEHLPHPAGPQLFQNLVLPDRETLPLALEELFGLEISQQSVADEQPRDAVDFCCGVWVGLQLLDVRRQARLLQDGALPNEVNELIHRRGSWHLPTCLSGSGVRPIATGSLDGLTRIRGGGRGRRDAARCAIRRGVRPGRNFNYDIVQSPLPGDRWSHFRQSLPTLHRYVKRLVKSRGVTRGFAFRLLH
jgi:hypothetical protein